MGKKTCYTCHLEKPITDFYVNKEMRDGHVNRCIECTRQYSRTKRNEWKQNLEWVRNERSRGRDKYYKLKEAGALPKKKNKMDETRRYRSMYPEKYYAKSVARNIPRKDLEQNHHWSYNECHWKDVVQLSIADHMKLHRYMTYDQERMMYRTTDGVLLDTKESHLAYFDSLKDKP